MSGAIVLVATFLTLDIVIVAARVTSAVAFLLDYDAHGGRTIVIMLHGVSMAAGALSVAWFGNVLTIVTTDSGRKNEIGLQIAMFVCYDLWLLLREQALQSKHFKTPKCTVYVGIFSIIIFIITGVAFDLLVFPFLIQLLFTMMMSWVFIGGLRRYGISDIVECNLLKNNVVFYTNAFSRYRIEGEARSPVLQDVIFRTGVGAILHILCSILVVVMIVIAGPNNNNSAAYAAVYCLFVLPVTLHIGVSHRDDVALRRVVSAHTAAVATRPQQPATGNDEPRKGCFRKLLDQMAAIGAEEAVRDDQDSSGVESGVAITEVNSFESNEKSSTPTPLHNNVDAEVDMARAYPNQA
jgi:hypothetical protein